MSRAQRILASISVVGLALMFPLTLVISYQFQSAGDYWDQAEHARAILIAVQNLNRGLMAAESGQRGFLLTSKPTYFDSYLKGVSKSQGAMIDIAAQLKANAAEQQQLAKLRRLVQAKLDELRETVELEQAHRHSEYALGRYGWVLSLMFLCLGSSAWALAVALWSEDPTRAGKAGLWFLIVAGLGGAMASVFDVSHETGHGIAGLLGVAGFLIGALLVSVSLGGRERWRDVRRGLLWLANLNWVSVVLLVSTLGIMTMQMMAATGGHLPQRAPKSLPPGVLAVDGWADRLIVLSNCAWSSWWHGIWDRCGLNTTSAELKASFVGGLISGCDIVRFSAIRNYAAAFRRYRGDLA